MSNADTEIRLQSAVNRFGNNGSLDLNAFESVLNSLGNVDQGKIQQWKNHFSANGRDRLTIADLRSVVGIQATTQEFISAAPVRQLDEVVYRAPAQRVEEVVYRAPAARVEEVVYRAPVAREEVVYRAPAQVRQYAPVQEKFVYETAAVQIDTIGPPPSVEEWLLVPVQATGGFGDHFNKAAGILREIEELELQQEQRIRNVLNGFSGAGGFSPKMDILHRLVDYCKELRSELNACANHDYNLQNQYDQLVAYLKQYQQWEIYVKGLKNYYNELQQALNEINVYKMKVQQLMDENKQLNIQISVYMNQISVLEQQKRALEERVRIIPFLQKIVIDQAFEVIQLKSDISGHIQDLNGLHGHYQGLFAQIAAVGNNQGSYTRQQRVIVRGLREACAQVIESACSASKDSLTGQDSLDRNQSRAVAQCILELDIDIHQLTGDHVESYLSSNAFDSQWNKYTQANGRLVGRANIMNFFEHVIEHKSQQGKIVQERVFIVEQPAQIQI